MARLEQALQLRELAQRLAASNEEANHLPVVVFGCLVRLQKARPRLVASLRASLGQRASRRSQPPKLKLWQSLASPDQVLANDLNELLEAIQQTEAWQRACITHERHRSVWCQEPWNHQARLSNAPELLTNLEAAFQSQQAVKLFFWHHFDAMGFVPQSWQNVLAALVQQGWVVVVSSSKLAPNAEDALRRCGCLISYRQNIGLCLGAYRDFCCLLDDHRALRNRIETLVLCNDSTLPLGGATPICEQTNTIHQQLISSGAKMIGLTDSVQTRGYHIQSYFIALNAKLLRNPSWIDFWHRFDPRGDKDDLINRGEVGLSQCMLRNNIALEAIYSLTSILLHASTARQALIELDVRQPEQINTTLMCWKALINAGMPIIKKQLLLEPPVFLPQVVPLTALSKHLNTADQDLIDDLAQLMQSRFLRT